MAAKKKYDFFISYRRANNGTVCGSYLVGLLSDYNVFYDVDSITEGKFDEQIRKALENTERFILVVTDGAFDRPEVPGKRDWYYEEIGMAIETVGLDRITPVIFSGTFNEDVLPPSLKGRGLRSCQTVKYVAEYAKYFKDEFYNHFGLNNPSSSKAIDSPTREQVEDDDYENEDYDDAEYDDEEYEYEDIDQLKQDAADGNPQAQNTLGNCYYDGEEVRKSYKEAAKWYLAAAEQGYDEAQLNLGDLYFDGEGVEEDLKEAVKWYKLAAEQGHPLAQARLGHCYYNGNGVRKSFKEAVKWYELSAEQDEPEGINALGNCYYNGEGVEQDYKAAAKLYRIAAEAEYPEAQFNLGTCYYYGEGVKENNKKAYELISAAADQDYDEAVKFLDENEF